MGIKQSHTTIFKQIEFESKSMGLVMSESITFKKNCATSFSDFSKFLEVLKFKSFIEIEMNLQR